MVTLPCDVSDTAARLVLIDAAGEVDILVNNAGANPAGAEPGLSQTGRPIWTCTDVNGDQVLTTVRETPWPSSITMP